MSLSPKSVSRPGGSTLDGAGDGGRDVLWRYRCAEEDDSTVQKTNVLFERTRLAKCQSELNLNSRALFKDHFQV